MTSNENVSTLRKIDCRQTLAPPRSQVEELQSILFNNKSYLKHRLQRRTARKVTFNICETERLSKVKRKEVYRRGWKPWAEFRPNDPGKENFAGNYRGDAAARKIASRKERRVRARSERTAEETSVANCVSEIN